MRAVPLLDGVGVAGTGQANRTYALVGFVEILTDDMHNLHAHVAMAVQEVHQVPALNFGGLYAVESFRRDLIGPAGKRGAQAEDFAGGSDMQNQATAVLRANPKAHAAFAEQEYAAGLLAFTE